MCSLILIYTVRRRSLSGAQKPKTYKNCSKALQALLEQARSRKEMKTQLRKFIMILELLLTTTDVVDHDQAANTQSLVFDLLCSFCRIILDKSDDEISLIWASFQK